MDEISSNFDLNLDDFDFSDFDDLENTQDLETKFIKPKIQKTLNSKQVKFDNAFELVEKIKMQANERVFALVRGNFIFSDLIVSFLLHHDIKAVRMDISTLSFDEYNVMALKEMFEKGYIEKLNFIISDYFYSHERKNKVQFIYDQLSCFDFQLAVLRSHVKTTLIETDRGNKFVIHGSANLRSSDNVEQFMIEENKDLFDFHQNHNNFVLTKFATIKRPLKNKDL